MIRSMEEFGSAFHAARCVSTPLVAVRTADPASTTYFLTDALKQSRQPPPLLGWDVIRGLYAIGKESGEELARVLGDREAATVGPADALSLSQQLGENGLLLYSNAHRFWDEPGVMQGILEPARLVQGDGTNAGPVVCPWCDLADGIGAGRARP